MSKTIKINYDFIDALRFISMFGIVMEHSSFFFGAKFKSFDEKIIQIFSLQFFKFGTIIFFLLAGFLIGDKFNTYSTKEYLKRRLDNTVKPWLFWVVVLLTLNYTDVAVRNLKSGDSIFYSKTVEIFFADLGNIIFNTSFWFIPNFLICIAILLLCRKYLYNLYFGGFLMVLSLLYSINLYLDIFPTSHTTALFGFIFYLWLGVQINRYYEQFKLIIQKTSLLILAVLTLITFLFSSIESYYLLVKLPTDPFNTLRITNILYSLVCFALLYKLGNKISLQKFKPSIFTFGIYLVHQILVFRLMPLIFRPLNINFENKSAYYFLAMQLLTFAVVYTGSILIVYLINKSKKARWVVGR